MFIVVSQLILNSYVRRRMHKDLVIAEGASRIASESIEYVRTVQALTRQDFFCRLNLRIPEDFHVSVKAFCSAARKPHRRVLIRGLLQALSFAFTSSYTSVNFGIAYSCGLLVNL